PSVQPCAAAGDGVQSRAGPPLGLGLRLRALPKTAKRPQPKSRGRQTIEREDFLLARRILMRRDPILAPVIRRHHHRSPLDIPAMDPFRALVRTITAQQISTKAAATIHGRFVALMPGGVSPEAMLALTDEQMRQAGLSRQKIAYLRDLSAK